MHWSKEFLRDELTERVKLLGGEIHRLPQSSGCYVISVNGEERLFVSLKEKKSLWVDIPNPLLKIYDAANERTHWLDEHAVIIQIYVPENALLFIPMKSVLKDRNDRILAGEKSIHNSVNIKMTGYKKYEIKTLDLLPNIPVEVIDDLGRLEELIKDQSLANGTTSMSNAGRHAHVAELQRRKRAVEEQKQRQKEEEEMANVIARLRAEGLSDAEILARLTK